MHYCPVYICLFLFIYFIESLLWMWLLLFLLHIFVHECEGIFPEKKWNSKHQEEINKENEILKKERKKKEKYGQKER